MESGMLHCADIYANHATLSSAKAVRAAQRTSRSLAMASEIGSTRGEGMGAVGTRCFAGSEVGSFLATVQHFFIVSLLSTQSFRPRMALVLRKGSAR